MYFTIPCSRVTESEVCPFQKYTQLRKPSNEIRNINCIVDSYTEYTPLVMRIHSKGFELALAAEIMARSTSTTRQPK